MPIQLLAAEVADKIAAGEVIERPVSVAKELLENAIDAGADDVQVAIAQGGRRLVQVVDNGCGIASDEVTLAFSRHATSKLTSAEELFRVRTLGFRGEALASIGAVSHLTLATRAADEEVGVAVRMEGGVLGRPEPQARPPGTTVQVENLFYNTPARLKFLRADTTEAGHIARLTSSYALAYPEIRFALENNGRDVLRTGGTGSLFDALVAILGLDIAEQMVEVDATPTDAGAIRVWGYISTPAVHRSNRSDILFFVNRRWVQDSSLTYAVTEAYQTLLPVRRYPAVVLNIEMPPEDVDVNIHPTKREVRFRQARAVFSAVQRAVRNALLAQRPFPVEPEDAEAWSRRETLRHLGQQALEIYRTADQPPTPLGPRPPEEESPAERLPMLRAVGQIAQTYILAEGPGGLYIIDQHAAHERIRYEELQAERRDAAPASQEMLEPLVLAFTPEQATLLEEHREALEAFGFGLEPFGGNSLLVRRVPASLLHGDVAAALGELVETMQGGEESASWEEQALITLSCHTAVRAGQTLSLDEMRDLIRQLERATVPHTCPHGRPIMIHLSQDELERQFLRT